MSDSHYFESSFLTRGDLGPLIGVHCEAKKPRPKQSLTVVIVAGQPQTRVGAHRMFVELARALADHGLHSVRFDCSGWGDSLGPARAFEESRFDILSVVRAIQRTKPEEQIAVLGLCDGATAAWLSLPLLKTDQRSPFALILINPWTDQKQFEAKARLSNYYLERLKSKEFWGKLVSGRVHFGSALGGAMQSIKDSQQATEQSNDDLASHLVKALQTPRPALLLILSEIDLTAQTFTRWMEHEDRLKQSFSDENTLRHSSADHTFSNENDWQEACNWIGGRLEHLLQQSEAKSKN